MNKELHQTVMIRTKLRIKFLKGRSLSDDKVYNIRRNECVNLLRKTKRQYYSNISMKNVQQKYEKTVKKFLKSQLVWERYL